MQHKLTREELYELVWSMPMTHAAKKLGISDVMLGKICKERDIPRPVRGYWAAVNMGSKKKNFSKPPLPEIPESTLTYHQMLVEFYEDRYRKESRAFKWEDLSVPISRPPDEPSLTTDEQVDVLLRKMPDIPEFEVFKDLHPVTEALVQADRLRKKRNYYASWEKPIFEDDNGKRLLSVLNGFAWILENLGADISSRGRIHIHTSFRFLSTSSAFSLNFFDPEPYNWRTKKKKAGTQELSIHFTSSESQWGVIHRGGKRPPDFNGEYIRQMLKNALVKKETDYRELLVNEYERCVESREWTIKKNEQKRLMLLKKERERVAAINARRVETLFDAVERMRKADGIRELVRRFEKRHTEKDKSVAGYDKWARWALQYAEQLDPTCMSAKHLETWVSK